MIITQPLRITTPDGKATGRWRLVEMSDEHDGAEPLCECGGRASDNPTSCGHESPAAASACLVASAKRLARVGFDAYGASTGGKTWDGKDIPPFDVIRERTPHVAKAWEDAATAILKEIRGARGLRAADR